MSQNKRRHGDHSNSLFPFLAVLLCTVGALILMLILIVDQSQASVKQAIDQRAEKAEELRAQVEVVRESFREDREKIQLEIEKKRMALQSLEQQTSELSQELEQLAKTSELIDKDLTDDDSVEKVEAALTDMQKQLHEAAERLKSKLDNPTKSKPVFAIIPYEGGHGTHRRPIYLECRADGILIQPEGVFIGLKDLRPPYGPGNPLDAALRAARTYYSPDGAALNAAAYPLLVVRSSGIRTYALARMAMAGWDDQFGYELIEDDMELAFPASESKLGRELERTLATARDRQAALVMAMPGRYRQAMDELSDDKLDMSDDAGQWNESAGGSGSMGSDGGFGFGGSGSGGDGRSNQLGSAGTGSTYGSDNVAGARGGFAFAPDGATSSTLGLNGAGPAGSSSAREAAYPGGNGKPGGGTYGFATGGNGTGGGLDDAQGNPNGNSMAGAGQPNGASAFGMGSPTAGQPGNVGSFAEGAFSGNQYTRAGSGSGNADTGSGGEGGGQQSSKGFTADNRGNGNSNGQGRPGTFQDAMNAARSKKDGGENAQGSTAGSVMDNGTGGSAMVAANSDGFGSMGPGGVEMNPNGSASPMLDMNMKKGDKKQSAEAVAKRRGRNWAWSAGPSRQTAVVRHIRVQCYEDRWVVMPDAGTKDKAHTVMLDVSLQTSAEQLAKVVADRMDRWGYALADGYWKPILQVEVAPRSDFRYTQLQRLLDGSGLEVQRVQAGPPTK